MRRAARPRYDAHMTLRERVGHVIFETDTPVARAFDVGLLWAILASVASVVLDSVPSVRAVFGTGLRAVEWGFTALFTVEYAARVWSARDRRRYVLSFYGLVDLIAVLPSYVALIVGAGPYLAVVRALRLLRVFRVLKLVRYLGEARVLGQAVTASRAKITVFLTFVLTVVLVVGAAMYLIEGPASGFDSIPISVYWAIVTLTTVGYGDIAPQTIFGKLLASIVMIMGYGIIAVPTGIVTVELAHARRMPITTEACRDCGAGGHDNDAAFCKFCGGRL